MVADSKHRKWKEAVPIRRGLLSVAWLLAACGCAQVTGSRPGEPAKEFGLPNLAGKVVSLSQYRGKVVLLDFWATWCVSCVEELPELKTFHAKYGPKGLAVLAASVDEGGRQAVIPFVAEHDIPYTVLLTDQRTLEAYGVWGLPTTFLIDREGIVRKRYVGYKSMREVESEIVSIL